MTISLIQKVIIIKKIKKKKKIREVEKRVETK